MREAYFGQKLASEPLALDPKNHCIRFIEILHVPDNEAMDLIVMPHMYHWNKIPFLTIGEAVEFFSQIFEVSKLPNHFIAEIIWCRVYSFCITTTSGMGTSITTTSLMYLNTPSDCKSNNIVMDARPLFRNAPHPWRLDKTHDFRNARPFKSRTTRPVKYYWIDFDVSDEYDPSKGPPLVDPGYGGIRHVPEFSFKDKKCNPFAVDVWCLGFFVQAYFSEVPVYRPSAVCQFILSLPGV
jgi:hypothetical protein